jgi:DNA polymerase-3 subunit alpha
VRQYVSLHNHTIGSIGDSLITPKQLIEATQEAGQTAVAVTDHGSMSRLWETYKVAKKAGIKLIAGCEIYFVDDASNEEDTTLSHLVLLAKNQKGYQNLLTLNKRGFDQQNANVKRAISRIDWKLLEQFHEGLICTSACGNGLIAQYIMHDMPDAAEQAAKRLSQIFGDDFALELQPHNLQRRPSAYSGPVNQQKINLALKKLSEKLGIRCIVATDAHYVKQAHHKAHDVYLCNASGQPITSGNRLRYDKSDFYVKNADEVYEHFTRHIKVWGEEFVESLFANTIYYADRCEDAAWISPEVMTGEKSQLPEFPFKDEPDYEQFKAWKADDSESDIKQFKKSDVPEDAQFYRYRTQVGLEKKIGQGKIPESDLQECIQQSLEEFDVFEYRGFSSYMLITADFLKWCRRNMIAIGPGRGSVGGSLTAYVNEIHQAYPKKYQLIFARFLNKYKEAFPDIDNDIAPSGRDKLHNYLRSKYGEGSVAHVSNVNTITPKVYARDIARVFEFDGSRSAAAEKGNLIADSIPAEMKSVKQALEEAPLFAEYAKQYPELAEFAELLCGLPRAWSTHAGGIVISKRPLEGLVPLRRDASGALVLEYDKEIAEENGLVKIDTLGLETLDIIGETYNIIKDTGKEMPADPFDYEIMDSMSYNLIGDGDTFGVFQLGSTAIPVCKKVRPQNVADIALVSALVRPAAKDTIPDLLKVRNGETKMNLMHPTLERAFASTYGYGLYEESLMYLAQDVAGWDLHDADKLRKLTKEKGKNPEKVKKWREEFIEGAQKNKGLSEEIATRVWDETIAQFGGYGFNRSLYFLESVDIFSSTGRFITSKPMIDVQPGEIVRSRDEETGEDIYVDVIANHDHGELEVFEVELITGEKVKCTMNHKFRTVETGEMLPLHQILKDGLSIVVNDVAKTSGI